MAAPRFVVWDFDGTLATRDGMWSQCLVDVVAASGVLTGVKRDAFVPFLQQGFPWHSPATSHAYPDAEASWANLLPVFDRAFQSGAGVSPKVARDLACTVRTAYTDPRAWTVYADTVPCLQQLTSFGWQHVILSNHVPELPDLVDALGLSKYFVGVFTSAATGFEKPHAGAFGAVKAFLPSGTQPVMVGDNYTADVAGAEAVGWPAVLVRRPHPQAPRFAASLSELKPLLEVPNRSVEATAQSLLRSLWSAPHRQR